MSDYEKTRFRKAEEALRFFFRLRELLHGGQVKRLVAGELPMAVDLAAADALDDYRAIGWSMRELDEVALWLVGEIYGPTAFGVRRRTFLDAGKAGRLAFPQRKLGLREIASIHERALGLVRRELHEIKLIPVRPLQLARKHRPTARSTSRPQYLRVSWTASEA